MQVHHTALDKQTHKNTNAKLKYGFFTELMAKRNKKLLMFSTYINTNQYTQI